MNFTLLMPPLAFTYFVVLPVSLAYIVEWTAPKPAQTISNLDRIVPTVIESSIKGNFLKLVCPQVFSSDFKLKSFA